MIKIDIKNNDQASFEKAMKLFKKLCQKDGFMLELRDRRYYKKPSQKRHEKLRSNKERK